MDKPWIAGPPQEPGNYWLVLAGKRLPVVAHVFQSRDMLCWYELRLGASLPAVVDSSIRRHASIICPAVLADEAQHA